MHVRWATGVRRRADVASTDSQAQPNTNPPLEPDGVARRRLAPCRAPPQFSRARRVVLQWGVAGVDRSHANIFDESDLGAQMRRQKQPASRAVKSSPLTAW